jgi:hypothetical protein
MLWIIITIKRVATRSGAAEDSGVSEERTLERFVNSLLAELVPSGADANGRWQGWVPSMGNRQSTDPAPGEDAGGDDAVPQEQQLSSWQMVRMGYEVSANPTPVTCTGVVRWRGVTRWRVRRSRSW